MSASGGAAIRCGLYGGLLSGQTGLVQVQLMLTQQMLATGSPSFSGVASVRQTGHSDAIQSPVSKKVGFS